MERMGFVIGIKPGEADRYARLHAAVWPAVLERIRACNIANYSIFIHRPSDLMFGYYEYHGRDHAADMARMAEDARTQDWWALCKPLMEPLATRVDGEFWAWMDRIFLMEA